ncbi:MAG: NADH-quinone oxidoreductase subunit H, partial [bacterium]|nr:NADH-quinone oxidoreductase subunit H [bacterium]
RLLFEWLIFPGFAFIFILSLIVSWIDRKVTARIHYRVGPPWYQGFADFLKLLGKETLIPAEGNKMVFLAAPIIGVVGAALVSFILMETNFNPGVTFVGDLIVILYLLILPPLAIILGGSASANPLAAIGVSREIKLLIAYELPFIISALIPVVKVDSIQLGSIINYQVQHGTIFTHSISGFLAFFVALLCMTAKLGYAPFDVAEAETELAGGAVIEYGGPPLAFTILAKQVLLFTAPIFLSTLFLGGLHFKGLNILWAVLKYVLVLVAFILIKNTNPRLRIDQIIKFFWGKVFIISLIAFVLAILGL